MPGQFEPLESRRLFAALTPEAGPALLSAPTAVQEAAALDAGGAVILSRGPDGTLTLRRTDAAGALIGDPVTVSGTGSSPLGVGSDLRALDVDRAGRVSVTYARGGTNYVRAFDPGLAPTLPETALGTALPLDLAVSASGVLIVGTTPTSLTVRRLSNAGADLGTVTAVSLKAPKDNVFYDFDSAAIDTDAVGGFVVGWAQATITSTTLIKKLKGGDVAESDGFDTLTAGGFFARAFTAAAAPAGPVVTALPRKSAGDAEVQLAVGANGQAVLVTAVNLQQQIKPVFQAGSSTFTSPQLLPVGSVVQAVRLAVAKGRLALAKGAKGLTLFSAATPDNATTVRFAGSALDAAVAADGIAAVAFGTRPFARAGEDLTADLNTPPTALVRRISAAGAFSEDPLALPDTRISSLALTGGGDVALLTVSGGTASTTQAFARRLIAPKPSLVPAAPAGSASLGAKSGRTLSVPLTLLNQGDAAVTGPAPFAATLRRDGQPDLALPAPKPPTLKLAPGQSAKLPLTFKLPSSLTPGAYTLVLTLDPTSTLADADRTDNTVSVPITVG